MSTSALQCTYIEREIQKALKVSGPEKCSTICNGRTKRSLFGEVYVETIVCEIRTSLQLLLEVIHLSRPAKNQVELSLKFLRVKKLFA